MAAVLDLRHRFPAITEGNYQGWARFDGPAGTQVVDSAIEAAAAWQRSGNNANSHGQFAAAEACDALVANVQGTLGRLLGADPSGFMFGPSTTNNVFSLSRESGATSSPTTRSSAPASITTPTSPRGCRSRPIPAPT